MKICPVAAEFFKADGRTYRLIDTTTLTVVFRSFANALKNERDAATYSNKGLCELQLPQRHYFYYYYYYPCYRIHAGYLQLYT